MADEQKEKYTAKKKATATRLLWLKKKTNDNIKEKKGKRRLVSSS